ncbi:Ig-like domain-containing protein [Candidatus Poribacteria bacterium]|nr:Ig-like domain-containing protein [Candidatus Poribacteria bacterium]
MWLVLILLGAPDTTPPRITDGTVADGTVDVAPAPISGGGFRFDFDEDITGTVKLTDETGADLNWIANVWGQTATLTAVAGQELANETTYKIEIDFHDGAGNALRTTITSV